MALSVAYLVTSSLVIYSRVYPGHVISWLLMPVGLDTYHSNDPFARMDGAMKNDGGFLAATATTENMQARDGIAITRGSRRDTLNIARVLRGNILHPLKMVIVWMVRCEPGGISRAGYQSHEGVKALHSDIAVMV